MSWNGRAFDVAEINKNQYQINFRTRRGLRSFSVHLSDQFPDAPPRVVAESRFTHSNMDQSGNITGIKDLNSWNATTSDLGQVVKSAVIHFTAVPPLLKTADKPVESDKVISLFISVSPCFSMYTFPVNSCSVFSVCVLSHCVCSLPSTADTRIQITTAITIETATAIV